MSAESVGDGFRLLAAFLGDDEYYGESSQAYGDKGPDALNQALQLFLARPELGFVWLGYRLSSPVAVCVVSLAISTSLGALVAKLDDVYVEPAHRGQGVGARLLLLLAEELRGIGVERVDTSVHLQNVGARRFYERLGFRSLQEERLARLLKE